MMSAQTLLSLETPAAQSAWLQTNAPTLDAALVAELHRTAQQRERIDPTTALPVASLVRLAAELWQDAATDALGQLLEANARCLLGDYVGVLPLYEAATAQYLTLGQTQSAAEAAAGHSGALQYLGRYAEAQRVADSAEKLLRDAGAEQPLAKLLLTRGATAARQNNFAMAQRYFAEAGALFHQINEPRFAAMATVNEAIVLTERNAFRAAHPLFEAARTTFAAADMADAVARTDLNLAYLYAGQGDTQNALQNYRRARASFAAQNNQREVANIDLHRSDIYLSLNLWHEALEQVAVAEPIFAAQGMAFEQGRLQLNRAVALAHNHQDASDALTAARGYFSAENNAAWQAVTDLTDATIALHQRQQARVVQLVERVLPTFIAQELPSRVAQCYVLLGEAALLTQQLGPAAQQFEHALAQLDNIPIPSITYACHYGLARIARQQGDRDKARHHLHIAIDDIEQLQASIGAEDYKIAFFSDKLAVYEDLVAICLSIDTEESRIEAFQAAERAKSRALLDTIARTQTTNAADDNSLLAQLAQLREELNWYYNQLNTPSSDGIRRLLGGMPSLTDTIAAREQALRKLLAALRVPDLISAPENPIWSVTIDQIRALLPANTRLLQFFTIGNEIVVFGIESDRPLTVDRLPATVSTVTNLFNKLRFQLNKFNFGKAYVARHMRQLQSSCNAILHKLYRQLWEPINSGTGDLIIVPHGPLHGIPFQALFDGAGYVLEQRSIAYAPSATVLAQTLRQPPVLATAAATATALLIGVADETIPHAAQEAAEIAAILGESAELRIGPHATFHTISDFTLLHLATHATFRADNPQYSALKLADRWLTVQEIGLLDRVPPFVTLSACETGRHHIATGDELVGLCRGFFAAGAQTLTVSLWNADDAATATLMRHYYTALRSGQQAHHALRAAQLAVKETNPHPYFWAAFALIGRPTLDLTSSK